jgi:serine/arginine repetitive matrix protein 2
LPSDEEEDALDCISPEYKRDVEMREATPNVEVAVPAVIASAASLTTDATAAVDTTMATTEAEEDLSTPTPEVSPVQQDIDATMSEFEAEIPQSQKATSTTSSTSKSRATKGRVSQVPCVICMRTPWHYQKDCPEVKAGADSLRYLLTARREQSESLDSEEDAAQLDQSIEAIQEWVERLENIAGKVQGVVKRNDFKPRSPVKVMGSEDGETVDLNADSMMKAEKSKADASIAISLPSAAPNSSKSPEVTTTQLPDKTASTSTQMVQPTPEIAPESPSTVPDTYNFPPIHLRAMRKGRRPGSTSALSVSDAIIETEPSDDSSSDDDDDQSESDTGKDEDKDEGGSESDTSSVVSTTSVNSSDSDVSSNSGSATSRVAMPSNPSDAMRFSLTRDLSEREKKKARLSAAKMQPVTFDQESVIDDNGNDEQEEEQVTPPTPVTRGRAGSDSSIGDFGDDASRRSSIDSTTSAPYRSQAPPVVASSAQPIRSPSPSAASEHESIEDANASASTSAISDIETPPGGDEDVDEGTPSTVARPDDTDAESEAEAAPRDENAKSSGQMSRSFRDIDGTAASSPDLDDSAGLEAVQQGIADEEDGTTTSQAEETQDTMAPIPVATQSLSQARRTRRSSAVAQSQEAPVSASQPLRRSSRTSVPPQDLPSRLRRSVSREVVEKTPPPPSRASRSVSRSMASMSPSTPKARRASNNLPRVEELDVETPKQVRLRVPRFVSYTVLMYRILHDEPAQHDLDSLINQNLPSHLSNPLNPNPNLQPPSIVILNQLPSVDQQEHPQVHYS